MQMHSHANTAFPCFAKHWLGLSKIQIQKAHKVQKYIGKGTEDRAASEKTEQAGRKTGGILEVVGSSQKTSQEAHA